MTEFHGRLLHTFAILICEVQPIGFAVFKPKKPSGSGKKIAFVIFAFFSTVGPDY